MSQIANAIVSRGNLVGCALPTSLSYSCRCNDTNLYSGSPKGGCTVNFKYDGGCSDRASRRKKVVMMGLSEEDGRSDEEGRSSSCSYADLIKNGAIAVSLSLVLYLGGGTDLAMAKRLEVANNPELLPKEYTTVIDVAGFLSQGQESRIKEAVARLEEDTGFKLRVLAQNYPITPGVAVREFWHVDEKTIIFVADPSLGNILNFNVGAGVDLSVPRNFWKRLAGKYGNLFYWREKGEDASIEAAVSAIGNCLRQQINPHTCSEIW